MAVQVEAPRLDESFDGRLAVENRYQFPNAARLGPESQRRPAVGDFSGTLFFYFGDPAPGAKAGGPGPGGRHQKL